MELTRRQFLKGSAGTVAGIALLQPSKLVAGKGSRQSGHESDLAMLIDVSKCIGCWMCYHACKRANGLPEITQLPDPENPPELAPATWTTLFTKKEEDKWHFRKHACMHCTDAACVKVCPTGALHYNELGFVQFDRDQCSGCGYCTQFCPFGVPQLQEKTVSGDAQMDKCTFCIDRVKKGQQTACAEACPTGAIKFGKRSELLEEGKQRVAELQQINPKACFYGDSELGGLHVMYVLEDSPEAEGLPDDPQVPAATMAHDIIKWVGVGGAAAMVAGFGLNYIVARARIAKEGKE